MAKSGTIRHKAVILGSDPQYRKIIESDPIYSLSERIRKAAESNSQISGSWEVPERVEDLVEKWAEKGI